MASVAFLFPGQGSQKVGMGETIFEASDVARSVFEEADDTLGEPLSKLCFEGPDEELKLTRNTQPAILATSIALLRALDAVPDVVAGHSLGEYTANVAAGTMAFADALRLVRQRGEFMQAAVPLGEGAMAAVMGLTAAEIEAMCQAIDGVVEAVNYNSAGQIVIAGARNAVHAAAEQLRESGARVIDLPVSAPFHSSLMRPAEEKLRPHLDAVPFADPRYPIYVNVDAVPVASASKARDALIRQVSRAVRWEQSITKMATDGVTLVVEIGEGTTLTSLVRRIDKTIERSNVQGPKDLEAARAAIAQVKNR